MKSLPIGEARRRLPELVKKVAAGHGSIAIGARGRATVALVPIGEVDKAPTKKPLVGLVTIVGGLFAKSERDEWLAEIDASLARTEHQIEPPRKRRRIKR